MFRVSHSKIRKEICGEKERERGRQREGRREEESKRTRSKRESREWILLEGRKESRKIVNRSRVLCGRERRLGGRVIEIDQRVPRGEKDNYVTIIRLGQRTHRC